VCISFGTQVVMLSITGVGALTKPLLGMLLRDGGDRMLAAQLSQVPLLGCAPGAGAPLHGAEGGSAACGQCTAR
jgi:hypothetical protein